MYIMYYANLQNDSSDITQNRISVSTTQTSRYYYAAEDYETLAAYLNIKFNSGGVKTWITNAGSRFSYIFTTSKNSINLDMRINGSFFNKDNVDANYRNLRNAVSAIIRASRGLADAEKMNVSIHQSGNPDSVIENVRTKRIDYNDTYGTIYTDPENVEKELRKKLKHLKEKYKDNDEFNTVMNHNVIIIRYVLHLEEVRTAGNSKFFLPLGYKVFNPNSKKLCFFKCLIMYDVLRSGQNPEFSKKKFNKEASRIYKKTGITGKPNIDDMENILKARGHNYALYLENTCVAYSREYNDVMCSINIQNGHAVLKIPGWFKCSYYNHSDEPKIIMNKGYMFNYFPSKKKLIEYEKKKGIVSEEPIEHNKYGFFRRNTDISTKVATYDYETRMIERQHNEEEEDYRKRAERMGYDEEHMPYALGIYAPEWDGCSELAINFYGDKCSDDFLDMLYAASFDELRTQEGAFYDETKEDDKLGITKHGFRSRFNNLVFYGHNGGQFDIRFLYEKLLYDDRFFIDTPINTENCYVSFTIYTLGKKGELINRYDFRDSMKLINGSLGQLSKELDIEHKKLPEDVNHVDIGRKLQEELEDADDVCACVGQETFNKLDKYLSHDCLGLYEILMKQAKAIKYRFNVEMFKYITQTSLAKAIAWKKDYYKDWLYTLNDEQHEFAKGAYFGGRTETFANGFIKETLFYYDFTSLYPDIGRLKLPIGPGEWITEVPEYQKDNHGRLNSHIAPGIYDVYIRTTKKGLKYKSLSCYQCDDNKEPSKEGKLTFPHFMEWTKLREPDIIIKENINKGLAEYMFAGKALVYSKCKCVFEDFFKEGFELKKEAKRNGNKALEKAAKILINSFYGSLGFNKYNREVITLEDIENPDFIFEMRNNKVKSYEEYGNYRVVNKYADIESEYNNMVLAAYITAYARRKITRLIWDIQDKGFELYYCDTDSVITNCDLLEHLPEWIGEGFGDNLGELKNELNDATKVDPHKQLYFKHGIFLGPKSYLLEPSSEAVEASGKNHLLPTVRLKGYKGCRKNWQDVELKMKAYVIEGNPIEQFNILNHFSAPVKDVMKANFRVKKKGLNKKTYNSHHKGDVVGKKVIPFKIYGETEEIKEDVANIELDRIKYNQKQIKKNDNMAGDMGF